MNLYKAINKTFVFSGVFMCLIHSIFSQEIVVNTGDLSVMPNTIMSVYYDFENTADGLYSNDGDVHFHKDFSNDGLVFFTDGLEGLTRFIGTENQELKGSMPSDFYDILLENYSAQPAFHLYSEITVEHQADFQQGIVNNQDYGGLIVFQPDAYPIAVDNDSHVDGFARKIGATDFEFPIGDGGFFRPASISNPETISHHFTAEYLLEASSTMYPHTSKEATIESIDNREYWIINRTSGNSEVLVTLSWLEDTTPSEIYTNPENNVHVVRWDSTNQIWVDEGGIVDTAAKTVTTAATITDYGIFTLARVNNAPVQASGITVYNSVTSNDDGKNDYFLIEGLEAYPENTLQIYNRWGVLVYQANNYGQNENYFKGYSNGRITLKEKDKLPVGTYYYILEYKNAAGEQQQKGGYLYLTY